MFYKDIKKRQTKNSLVQSNINLVACCIIFLVSRSAYLIHVFHTLFALHEAQGGKRLSFLNKIKAEAQPAIELFKTEFSYLIKNLFVTELFKVKSQSE